MSAVARTELPSADMPVGTCVIAFPGSRDGRALLTHTRSGVWAVSGMAVVSVDGYPGGIALTHIEVVPT